MSVGASRNAFGTAEQSYSYAFGRRKGHLIRQNKVILERVRIFIAPTPKGTSFWLSGHAVWGGVRIFQAKHTEAVAWKFWENLGWPENGVSLYKFFYKTASFGQLAYSWFWLAPGCRRVRVFIALFSARCAKGERVRIFLAPAPKGTSFCFAGYAVWGGVRIFQAKHTEAVAWQF